MPFFAWIKQNTHSRNVHNGERETKKKSCKFFVSGTNREQNRREARRGKSSMTIRLPLSHQNIVSKFFFLAREPAKGGKIVSDSTQRAFLKQVTSLCFKYEMWRQKVLYFVVENKSCEVCKYRNWVLLKRWSEAIMQMTELVMRYFSLNEFRWRTGNFQEIECWPQCKHSHKVLHPT